MEGYYQHGPPHTIRFECNRLGHQFITNRFSFLQRGCVLRKSFTTETNTYTIVDATCRCSDFLDVFAYSFVNGFLGLACHNFYLFCFWDSFKIRGTNPVDLFSLLLYRNAIGCGCISRCYNFSWIGCGFFLLSGSTSNREYWYHNHKCEYGNTNKVFHFVLF
mgnify:CR=1 FL=1